MSCYHFYQLKELRIVNSEQSSCIKFQFVRPFSAVVSHSLETYTRYSMKKGLFYCGYAERTLEFYAICHTKMEEIVPSGTAVRLVAFNVGYLPGGDKKVVTLS